MPKLKKEKQYITERYRRVVKDLAKEGFDQTDIALIMNRDKSAISRILSNKKR